MAKEAKTSVKNGARAQLSKGGETTEQITTCGDGHSLKFLPTEVRQTIVDKISATSNPSASHHRVTIGRIEVQVNNVSRPVENRARTAVTSSPGSDFLEERYLNRFSIKP
jgi:hypothetical protein